MSPIAERIQEACQRLNLTTQTLAEKSGVSVKTIQNIRYQKHHPTPIILDRIGKALGIELHERLEDREETLRRLKSERDQHAAGEAALQAMTQEILLHVLRHCSPELIAAAIQAAGVDRVQLARVLLEGGGHAG